MSFFYIKYIILYLALLAVVVTDFLLPIIIDVDVSEFDSSSSEEEENKKETTIFLIIQIIIYIPFYFLFSAYTIITIYSITRRTYITGDFLSGKHINDNLNLMKTLKIFCEDAFVLVYCNFYFSTSINKLKPKFYEETIIPDYVIYYGISFFMVTKIVIISVFAYFTYKVEKYSFFLKMI